MAGWYRQGTVALTPGSAAVAGTGTMWLGVLRPGSAFTTDGRTLYEIREVADDRNLTLDRPWEGQAAASATYAVIAATATLSNAELAGEIAAMVAKWAVREDQYDDWLGGSPNGGPNHDGKYPLTDSKGVTRLVESPARLLQLLDDGVVEHAAQIIAAIEDDVATARQAATNASAAIATVKADRQAVEQAAAAVATQSKDSATAAATATAQAASAVQHADAAAGSAATATSQAATASAALSAVEAARDIVLEARAETSAAATGAQSAKAASEAARDIATGARDTALEARDTAQAAGAQARDWATKTDAAVSGSLKSALSYALDAAAQATIASTKANESAGSAAAAATSAATLDAAATNAQTAAGDAAASAQTASVKAAAAALSADTAGSAAQTAQTAAAGGMTAKAAAEAARDSAATAMTAAQVAATQAGQSQINAANSAQTAAGAASDAISAKSDATAARDLAASARTEAQGARDLAQAFAQGAVGYQPSPGVYSAFHWSEQAKGHAQTAATIVGGSNFGIVGDGTSQRFAAGSPGSLLNFVQAPGGKITFNPGNQAVAVGFDATTAPVATTGGITAGTVQGALEEMDHRLSAGAAKLTTPRSISLSGGATGTATAFDGSQDIAIPVTAVSASALTGTVPLANLPAGALERLVTVASDAERFALTTATVQLGDTVQVGTSGPMYRVIDEANLNNAAGYRAYTASRATAVDWSGVENRPTTRAGYGITDAQPLNGLLTSIAALDSGTGLLAQTSENTAAKRAIGVASATDIPDRAAADGRYAQLSGATFTGGLNVRSSAVEALHVENAAGTKFSFVGFDDGNDRGRIGAFGGSAWKNLAISEGGSLTAIGTTMMPTGGAKLNVATGMQVDNNSVWHAGNAPIDTAASPDTLVKRTGTGALAATDIAIRTTNAAGQASLVLGNDVDALDAYYQINGSGNGTLGGPRSLNLIVNNGGYGLYAGRLSPRRVFTMDASSKVIDFAQQPTVNGQPLVSTRGSVAKSAVTTIPAAGSVSVPAQTIPAVYTQFVGQTFTVEYNTEAQYSQENAATGTDQAAGAFQLHNMAGGQIDSATKLLIHADGANGSTEIIDERGITPFGTHCGWLDGSSYWTVPKSYKLGFGANQDFTVSCWIRISSEVMGTSAAFDFIDCRDSGSTYWPQLLIGMYGNWANQGKFYFYVHATATTSSFVSAADTWHFVEVVRYAGTMTMYVNGVVAASRADSTSFPAAGMRIGGSLSGAGYSPVGWIDQVHVSRVARHTAAYATPSAAEVADANSIHLFTFDDGHGGQVLKDRANSGRPILLGGTGATISNEQAKFGTTSFKLGAGGSCVIGWASTPHADLALGDNNFTTDLWFYKTNTADGCLWCAGNNAYGMQIRTNGAGGAITAYISTDNSSWNVANGVGTGVVPAVNSWNHLAVVRNGGTLYIFLNGTQIGSHTVGTGSITMGGPYHYFGGVGDNSSIMAGYIDEVRIKRGEAVWISNFTPPTAPYTADDRTVVLLHFEGANGDVVTLDSSGSSYGTSAFSTTTTTLAFTNAAALSSAQARGGHSTSLYTGGSQFAQWLLPDNPAAGHPLYFGNYTKWCVEAWAYIPAGGSLAIFQIGQNPDSGSMRGGAGPSGTTFYVNGSAIATGPAPATGWNHFAFVREGRGWCVYVNGIAGAIAAPSTQFTTPGSVGNLWVGAWNNPLAIGDGYFDAIRITNGNPRYTANFTPATLVADDMTTLMWVFNGAVGQKWVKELSGNSAMIAASGNARTVKDGRYLIPVLTGNNFGITTVNSRFGGGALQGNGTAGNYLYAPHSLEFCPTGDYTFDFWANVGVGAGRMFGKNNGTTWSISAYWTGSVITFQYYDNAGNYNDFSSTDIATGTHHFAFVRSGTTVTIYVDGVANANRTWANGVRQDTAGNFQLLAQPDGSQTSSMWIDEFRYSTVARWTSNFTPPTIPYGQQYVTGPFAVSTTAATSIDVSDWSTIHSATISQTTPPGTSIRWAVSFDGRASWKTWNGSAWAPLSSSTGVAVDANGNDYLTLQNALANLNVEAIGSIDFLFSLKTNNPNFSPSVDAVTLARDEYELAVPKTDYTIKRNGAAGTELHRITNLRPYPVNIVYDYVA
ncbi:LamG domain-containing protein [Azospirillum sp. B510]|uniref:LamG domain-containing protein n=2 Tax=Alphaproteobacteria TaxID=28211 RepID=UPI0002D29973|nr:LamG domain-containing protein [Azospirillum sp. B510]